MTDGSLCGTGQEETLQVKDAPLLCFACKAPLCLRKQVINLSLGNTDEMLCLVCLSKENEQSPAEILESVTFYILRRECLVREWQRYETVAFCPDRCACFPDICFQSTDKT